MAGKLRAVPVASKLEVCREASRTGADPDQTDQIVASLYPMRSSANQILDGDSARLPALTVVGLCQQAKKSAGFSDPR
jgi:hypothetical protein